MMDIIHVRVQGDVYMRYYIQWLCREDSKAQSRLLIMSTLILELIVLLPQS